MSEEVHTIPVPKGWSPEQAWETLKRGDQITVPTAYWVNVVIRDGHLIKVAR